MSRTCPICGVARNAAHAEIVRKAKIIARIVRGMSR